ncbi:hypothetical protein BDN72DRAFT_846285 [Pluteus cervinus]|uniref:Uncharacterized protein n=1 Tax=Pluteus cervinus TaxID=181527 RepID=A0ACD3AH46_9AGAR|nr:hypothetical protein BDN72DRAFT_846285 [Pluteus cervinus]
MTNPDLSPELLEHILNWVEHRRDLISFACVSKMCKEFVIPRHTEYRVLRLSGGRDWVTTWNHLTRRLDLVSNFRTIHFVSMDNAAHRGGFRVPSTWEEKVDQARKIHLRNWKAEHIMKQIEAICEVMERVEMLHTFIWERLPGHTVIGGDEKRLLGLVAQKPTLRRLELSDEWGLEGLFVSLEDIQHPIWHMAHLESLVIGYHDDEELLTQDENFGMWVQSMSSTLTFLSIPEEIFVAHCDNFRLPSLTNLLLPTATDSDETPPSVIVAFLESHPHIEELSWMPRKSTKLASGCLPNLQKLACSPEFFLALDSADDQPLIPRRIEELGITWRGKRGARIGVKRMVGSQCFDHTCLKRLRFERWAADSFEDHLLLAKTFPNIRRLNLRWRLKDSEDNLSKEQWIELLSSFSTLEAFLGDELINSREPTELSEPEICQVVRNLAPQCPKLRQIAHHAVVGAEAASPNDVYTKITIIKEEPQGETLTAFGATSSVEAGNGQKFRWERAEYPPRDRFQTMPWGDHEW